MNKTTYILTIFAVVLTVGCKKIKPPIDESEANDPIYKIEGIMNGDSLKLYVDDSTVFIDNALYDFNGVEAFSSTISDVENHFELTVVVVRPEIFIDEEGVKLIENKDVDFLIDQAVCLVTSFGNSNQNDYFHINIDEQEFSGGHFGTHGYGLYQVGLQFPSIDTKIYDINLPIGFNNTELIPTFNLDGFGNNLIEFSSDDSSIDASHQWFVDDVLMNTQANFIDSIGFGLHSIEHKITDQYGNIANHKTMFYVNNNTLEWMMKFEENVCNNDYYQSNNYGRGFIEVNRKGELFSSLYNPNNTAYKLKVSNIEYILDGQSQAIKIIKFNLNFDAELKNKNQTETILLQDMEGVFQIKIN